MKYCWLYIVLTLFSVLSWGQKTALQKDANGIWPVIVNDSTMFISSDVDSLTEKERYFNPVYLVIQSGKEHLSEQLIRASICDCDTNLPNRRIGIFSVALNRKVSFSQGNLQYLPMANVWKFADTQYEYLGASNKYLSSTYRNWVDLLDWNVDETGVFKDWGTDEICGDKPGTWRTLTKEEWEYLFQKRPNSEYLCGVAQVGNVNGIIILPDNWYNTTNLVFKHGFHDAYSINGYQQHQSFTSEEWIQFEKMGAVFLPASGSRINQEYSSPNYHGYYWSSTRIDQDLAIRMLIRSDEIQFAASNIHTMGRSVRLVHDTIVPQSVPNRRIGVFSVANGKQVSFSQGNLQYIHSTNEWRFADEQYLCLGKDNLYGEQLADTIDMYGWSSDNSASPWGILLSLNSSLFTGTFKDWGNNAIGLDGPNSWRTLEHKEWCYLLFGRLHAESLRAHAMINNVPGILLFPDNWKGVDSISLQYGTVAYTSNQLSLNQWNTLESSGVVFLPAAGMWRGNDIEFLDEGFYWSSTPDSTDSQRSHILKFSSGRISQDYVNARAGHRSVRLVCDTLYADVSKTYRYGFTEEEWDGAVNTWGHGGRAHAPSDQSCIQGTIVRGIRLKVGRKGSLNVYKVPTLLETNTDNFELIATLTTDSTGEQDFDLPEPIYVGENEYLVFGNPNKSAPTLLPCYNLKLPNKQAFSHYIGTEKVKNGGNKASLMVEFY